MDIKSAVALAKKSAAALKPILASPVMRCCEPVEELAFGFFFDGCVCFVQKKILA